MGYLDSPNMTGSALTAEWFRMGIIMQNLVNQNTTRTAEGGSYKRKQVVFRENTPNFKSGLGKVMTKAENGGVFVEEVAESQNPSAPVHDLNHPGADEDGYMMIPNANSVEEMVGLMVTSRACEANATAPSIAKGMALKALEIGK